MRAAVAIMTMLVAFAASEAKAQGKSDHLVLGQLFCDLRKDNAEVPVRYLLTEELLKQIDAAEAASQKFETDNPGDKPPLGDGIPFQSYPDVADQCRPASYTASGGNAQIDIQYSFTATPDANFTDRLVVKMESGRPLIDDVLYATDDYKLGLRKVLADIVAGKY